MQPSRLGPTTSSLLKRSSFINALHYVYGLNTRCNHSDSKSSTQTEAKTTASSASSKLFADAAQEEAEESLKTKSAAKSSRLSVLEQQHDNWTGDESIQDAVLRMLVDKYKPLRIGSIQSAEEKLKRAPPTLSSRGPSATVDYDASPSASVGLTHNAPKPPPLVPASGSWAAEPLLPSTAGHEPWHTTFKAPSHDVSSIKFAQMPPPMVSSKITSVPVDDRSKRLQKEQKRKAQHVGRLTQAKESTLDYRMGVKRTGGGSQIGMNRLNPASVKGWTNLVEDRIERARQAGLFKSVKGRGQPLARTMEERNPFIAREEFLMNRIVQRNGAAPPWVEVQGELEQAVRTFRQILRQSYIRRALRMLNLSYPHPVLLSKLTLEDIKSHRDSEWVAKEKSYHETAIAELNGLVRKYNGLAPYAVRRNYYMREAEVERLYVDCADDIFRGVKERCAAGHASISVGGERGVGEEGGGGSGGSGSGQIWLPNGSASEGLGFGQWMRDTFRRLFGRHQ